MYIRDFVWWALLIEEVNIGSITNVGISRSLGLRSLVRIVVLLSGLELRGSVIGFQSVEKLAMGFFIIGVSLFS
jgi:hypothetical protein